MKCISLNVNGIRSSIQKNLLGWLQEQAADFICLQEVRAQFDQIPSDIFALGYQCHWAFASKPGYSGVAILSKLKPISEQNKIGHPIMDDEGRYLLLEYRDFNLVSLYLPSGTSGEARQQIKFECLEFMTMYLAKISKSKKPTIVCGDFNIAHQNIDLKNWRNNQKNSGFLPEERAWLDLIFNEMGFVDVFRTKYPQKEEYTWWSTRANARAKNVGWRIDYHITTPDLKSEIKDCWIENLPILSDHAPQIMTFGN